MYVSSSFTTPANFTELSSKNNFCIIKITLMVRKTALNYSLQACVGPTTPPLLGKRLTNNSTVEPMLGQCQHANNDVLPITPTNNQRWPNDCLLSGFSSSDDHKQHIFNLIENYIEIWNNINGLPDSFFFTNGKYHFHKR